MPSNFLKVMKLIVSDYGDWLSTRLGNSIKEDNFFITFSSATINRLMSIQRVYMYSCGFYIFVLVGVKVIFNILMKSLGNKKNSYLFGQDVEAGTVIKYWRNKAYMLVLAVYHLDFYGIMLRAFSTLSKPGVCYDIWSFSLYIDWILALSDVLFGGFVQYLLWMYCKGKLFKLGATIEKLPMFIGTELNFLLYEHFCYKKGKGNG